MVGKQVVGADWEMGRGEMDEKPRDQRVDNLNIEALEKRANQKNAAPRLSDFTALCVRKISFSFHCINEVLRYLRWVL